MAQLTGTGGQIFLNAKKIAATINVPKELLRDAEVFLPFLHDTLRMFRLFDLTRDSILAGLFASWARRPFDSLYPNVIADRIEELGLDTAAIDKEESQTVRELRNGKAWVFHYIDHYVPVVNTRQRRREKHKQWRQALVTNYGDFKRVLKPPDEIPF